MSTLNIQTVGTGQTHANLKAFASWLQSRDLVANDEIVEAHVFNDQTTTDMAPCQLVPLSFSESCYCIVRPAPNLGVNDVDTSGPFEYGAEGIELSIPTSSSVRVSHGVILTGFRIKVLENSSATSQSGINVSIPNTTNKPNGVKNATFTKNRVKGFCSASGTSAIYTGEYQSASNITDNLFIHEQGSGRTITVGMNCKLERNTIIRRGTAEGTTSGITSSYGTFTIRDNVFLNCGSTPIVRNSESTSTTYANNFANVAISGTSTGFTVDTTNPLVQDIALDYRPATGGPLIGAASATAEITTDSRGNNRGLNPDVGAIQLDPAPPLPVITITNIDVVGQTVTISGTTENTPTTGTASITPSNVPYNSAESQGPISLSFGTDTFSVTFNSVKVGSYSAIIDASHTDGPAETEFGSFNVTGSSGTVSSQTLNGQILTISGSTTGTPDSGTILVPAASNANGAITIGPISLTLGTDTFSTSVVVPPGNYDAPIIRFTTSAGTSLPITGTSAISILAISGFPDTPELPEGGSPPTVSITSVTMNGTTLSASGNADLQGDASGSLVAYIDPQPSGAPLGPFTVSTSNGTWTYSKNLTEGRYRLRLSATANQLSATASSTELKVLDLMGVVHLPMPS